MSGRLLPEALPSILLAPDVRLLRRLLSEEVPLRLPAAGARLLRRLLPQAKSVHQVAVPLAGFL
ncbi:MAG: hypothetical protein JW818_11615 [Pirellulales bacterium]|nr:hypothetical protein [Pirellulales bacterium]